MRKIVERWLDDGGPLLRSKPLTYNVPDQFGAQPLTQHVDRGQAPPGNSNCQKVQPLQASSPWTWAPMWWIEPGGVGTPPEYRRRAPWPGRCLRLADAGCCPAAAGRARPPSRRECARLGALGAGDLDGVFIGLADFGDAGAGHAGIGLSSRSMPMKWRPSRLATAPVVPEPKKGSRTTSPGLVEENEHPVQQRFRLLGRMGLLAVRPSAVHGRSRSAGSSRSASAVRRSAPSWPRS